MSTEPGPERLGCGRRAAEVLHQVAEGRGAERDAHQRRCPYCQAALAEFDRLWAPVRDLVAERVDPPDSIMEAVLRRIHDVVDPPDYGLVAEPGGVTRIAARVVVVTARESAQAVPGVRVALSRRLAADGVEVSAGLTGRSTAIEITLAADYGQDLHRLAERVRSVVAERIRALTPLEPVEVTVIVDDVLT